MIINCWSDSQLQLNCQQIRCLHEISVSSISNDWSIQSISIKSDLPIFIDLSIDKSIPIFIDWLLPVSIAVDVTISEQIETIGTLSKYDDDGSENVAKKMNLRSFKPNRDYLDPLKMSNADDFSWSWILKDFIQVKKEKGELVVVCQVQLGGFTS